MCVELYYRKSGVTEFMCACGARGIEHDGISSTFKNVLVTRDERTSGLDITWSRDWILFDLETALCTLDFFIGACIRTPII